MHRHFLFVEPNEVNPMGCEAYTNYAYKGGTPQNSAPYYALANDATSSSYIASGACRSGKVLCGTRPQSAKYFEFGRGDNPNYIWNELGAGNSKTSNV